MCCWCGSTVHVGVFEIWDISPTSLGALICLCMEVNRQFGILVTVSIDPILCLQSNQHETP